MKKALTSQMRSILVLAIPVAVAQLGQMLMGVVDIFMVGKLGPAAIGAVSVANAIFYVFAVGGLGLLLGLDYLVSHAFGKKNLDECHYWFIQAIYTSIFISLVLIPIVYLVSENLAHFGMTAEILVDAAKYLKIMCINIWPFILFMAFRQYLQAMNAVRIITVLMILANAVNAFLNWLFIYGHFGLPPMGVPGSALATTLTRIALVVFLGLYILYRDRIGNLGLVKAPFKIDIRGIKRILSLGIPASLQLIFEISIFSLSTTLAARLGTIPLAAHTIVLNLASLTFMVPMGISAAAAVRVGQALGEGAKEKAREAGWTCLFIGSVFMLTCGVLFWAFRFQVARIFTQDVEVIKLASEILVFVAGFQVFDGAQAIATGALRGLSDTKSSMYANLFGHWVLGLGLGYYLCFYTGMKILGIWAGLTLGLAAVALIVVFKWSRLSNRHNTSNAL